MDKSNPWLEHVDFDAVQVQGGQSMLHVCCANVKGIASRNEDVSAHMMNTSKLLCCKCRRSHSQQGPTRITMKTSNMHQLTKMEATLVPRAWVTQLVFLVNPSSSQFSTTGNCMSRLRGQDNSP